MDKNGPLNPNQVHGLATEDLDENGLPDPRGNWFGRTDDDGYTKVWQDMLGSGAVMKKVLVEGSGPRSEYGQYVTFSYACRIKDTETIIEQQTRTMPVGEFEELQGLELATRLMLVGEKCLMKTCGRFAYGNVTCVTSLGFTVPPQSDVEYDIEMHSFGELKQEDVLQLSSARRMEIAQRKKLRGNDFFKRKDYSTAQRLYSAALEYLMGWSDEECKAHSDELRRVGVDCCNNLATVYLRVARDPELKHENFEKCKDILQRAIVLDPFNFKALFLIGHVCSENNEFEEAKIAFERALEVEPDNKLAQQEMRLFKQRVANHKKKEKDMFKGMFDSKKDGGKALSLTDDIPEPKKQVDGFSRQKDASMLSAAEKAAAMKKEEDGKKKVETEKQESEEEEEDNSSRVMPELEDVDDTNTIRNRKGKELPGKQEEKNVANFSQAEVQKIRADATAKIRKQHGMWPSVLISVFAMLMFFVVNGRYPWNY